ncbi:hypothetical protein [Algoriphagus winogradskyi]|uniref:DUF4878 domain-containing protein n=1 Tax=Algoriphagus winogradskyi TaxID=237017 RepID=A0ABY1PEN4_9BACT|nr:hypothetical protein [Algoriphagus winogradskyi]SMP31766.1 hypothetical protein SAMN06265367_107212 [Algoriphagus winogradskyi]
MKFYILIIFFVFTLLSFSQQAFSQTDPEKIVVEFFNAYEKSPNEALLALFEDNPWLTQNPGALDQVKVQLQGALGIIGDYRGYEKISQMERGESLIKLVYFAKYDRQPLRFIFLFYKADDKWMIQNFLFDDKFWED